MRHGLVVTLVIVLGLIGWRFKELSAQVSVPGIQELQARNGVPVRLGASQTRNLADEVELRGQLVPSLSVPAAFQVDGRLVEVTVDVGHRVRAGQLLARVDDRSARADVAVARAALAGAEAALAKAKKGPRPQELQQARAGKDAAKAALAFAVEELERVRSLVDQRAASRQQLDRAVSSHDGARAHLRQAEETLSLLKEGTREEDIAAAQAQRDLAAARLELAEISLSHHRLLSPMDGVVTEREVDPGCYVKNMANPKTIVELAKVDPIHFVVQVSELYIPHLSPTDGAVVRLDALPGENFPAKLHEIAPVGNSASRSFRVTFSLDNADGRLRPGMFGRTRVVLREGKNVLTVPSHVLRDPEGLQLERGADGALMPRPEALKGEGRRAVVMVAGPDGRALARAVRVGIDEGGRAEILEGLGRDEVLVVEGFEELRVGQKIAAIEDSAGREG